MSLSACFLKAIGNGLMKKPFYSQFGSITANFSSLWEPNYLILAKTKTPEYDLINVQVKGYDFVILENYQSLIHKIAKIMELEVTETWASPQQDLKIQKYVPNSSNVEEEYKLKVYERNVQLVDVKSHVLPLFIEAVATACPPGVKLSVHEHEPEMEEYRYVPDYQILEKEKELQSVGAEPKKKPK